MKRQILAWAALAVALMGCSSKKSQIEDQFMAGCVGSNGARAQKKICSCLWEKLEGRHPTDELVTLAEQQPQRLFQEMIAFAPSCRPD